MKTTTFLGALAVSLVALATGVQAATVQTFDTGNQNWLVSDALSGPGAGLASGWDSAGQRLSSEDLNGWNTFSAPTALLGNLSALAGQTISFELQDTLKDANADNYFTFGIHGSNGVTLLWFGGSPSTTAMTLFSATLGVSDTRWRVTTTLDDPNSGAAPTATDWSNVLANVDWIRFDADWNTGADSAFLDNVVLGDRGTNLPVPVPATAALAVLGLACLGLTARRRR